MRFSCMPFLEAEIKFSIRVNSSTHRFLWPKLGRILSCLCGL
uniref:Uncharacterized protein n=1 Tax=Arundo donax TaxID=35708 RepID=A0A0A9BRV0_ARUDO